PLKLNLSRIAHSGDVQLSDEQNQILNLAVNSHNSIFYTGSAGKKAKKTSLILLGYLIIHITLIALIVNDINIIFK
ncbi:12297_t:CDS:1, partial [Entrophospora sp. SA101]